MTMPDVDPTLAFPFAALHAPPAGAPTNVSVFPVHTGPLPVMPDAVPLEQRLVVGAIVNTPPLLLPQVPLTGTWSAAKFAVMV